MKAVSFQLQKCSCCNIITLGYLIATPILQVSKEQFDKILDMCKQGEEQGAKLECGGKRLGDKGYYIEPTVFSNVQDDNIIATDEIFGPVQSILKWKTVEEVMTAVCPLEDIATNAAPQGCCQSSRGMFARWSLLLARPLPRGCSQQAAVAGCIHRLRLTVKRNTLGTATVCLLQH